MLPEGVLNPAARRAEASVSGEAPAASLPEGVLNPAARRAEASVSGEAPAASLPEGVLNPIKCVLSPNI